MKRNGIRGGGGLIRAAGRRMILLLLLAGLGLLSGCGGAAGTGGADSAESAAGQDTAAPDSAAGTDLTIYCFSAGKADAFLLYTANSAILVDAGEKGFGKEILAYLEEQGITRLDYLMITHFDQDHVGGAAKVINNIPVGTVLQSNSPKDSGEYGKYIKALGNAGIEPVTVRERFDFVLDGVAYSIDPPRAKTYREDKSNNSSLILSVKNGQNRFLFTGDAQTERIEEFLEGNRDTYDVLKVPHHGKEEPLTEALLKSVSPDYAIITSSDEEPESESVLALLEDCGAETYLTRTAPILIRSSGGNLKISYTA